MPCTTDSPRPRRRPPVPLPHAARGCGATPAQVSPAWLPHRGDDIVPIPGTMRRATLEENLAAAELSLGPDELRRLDAALPPSPAAGTPRASCS
ncbi:aldo/keto reductase [Streptomyces sp. NPDC048295]|uniref:aldo/keto reductase n=1 Tax=Streptomyces sp. NPDC048295 TaxID=3154617 RepID=UPI00343D0528